MFLEVHYPIDDQNHAANTLDISIGAGMVHTRSDASVAAVLEKFSAGYRGTSTGGTEAER